jgi:hypothetical protein
MIPAQPNDKHNSTYSIPDLELDLFGINVNGSCSELNTNCEVVLLSESLVSELEEETRLANT